jgi:NOL1/NOP2/fmu family ribosome biogenesis protein
MEAQHKTSAALTSERNEAAASLKTERASVAARGRQVEVEAAPIRYAAELFGISGDDESNSALTFNDSTYM